MTNEQIIYLLRKTSLTRADIGKLSPSQFNDIFTEVCFQESVDEYRNQFSVASLLAAIYNTIPRKRGSKVYKAGDFLSSEMPTRKTTDKSAIALETLAEEKGINLPTKEIKKR